MHRCPPTMSSVSSSTTEACTCQSCENKKMNRKPSSPKTRSPIRCRRTDVCPESRVSCVDGHRAHGSAGVSDVTPAAQRCGPWPQCKVAEFERMILSCNVAGCHSIPCLPAGRFASLQILQATHQGHGRGSLGVP